MSKKDISLDSDYLNTIQEKLRSYLAHHYTLYYKTQHYHWDIQGNMFYPWHKMFEEQYEELAESVDELAERIRMLGGFTPHNLKSIHELSTLNETQENVSAQAMLKDLINNHQVMIHIARDMITECAEKDDHGTADLLTVRIQAHEKMLWMLESSLDV